MPSIIKKMNNSMYILTKQEMTKLQFLLPIIEKIIPKFEVTTYAGQD